MRSPGGLGRVALPALLRVVLGGVLGEGVASYVGHPPVLAAVFLALRADPFQRGETGRRDADREHLARRLARLVGRGRHAAAR
jgi:hypothetical protein